jgi:hypothetical protein
LVRSLYIPYRGGDHPALFLPLITTPRIGNMEYNINKGIGKSVEFKGLKAQYLFIFAGGLLSVFVLFVILYMIGIDQWICIGFGVIAASVLVWLTFDLNRKYGENGLMKIMAKRQHPRYLINRKIPYRLFRKKKKAL